MPSNASTKLREFLRFYLDPENPKTYFKPAAAAKAAGYGDVYLRLGLAKILERRQVNKAVARHMMDAGLSSHRMIMELITIAYGTAEPRDRMAALNIMLKNKLLKMPLIEELAAERRKVDKSDVLMQQLPEDVPGASKVKQFEQIVKDSTRTAKAQFPVPERVDTGLYRKPNQEKIVI